RESLRLEQRARRRPELIVVVDDQHGRAHAPIVAKPGRERIVATRNRAWRDSRAGTEQRLWRAPVSATPPSPSLDRRKQSTDERGNQLASLILPGHVHA